MTADRRYYTLTLLGAYVVFTVSYLSINVFSLGRPAHTLFLPGEQHIPFIPAFEYLYILGYALPVLAVFQLPDRRRLRRLVWAFAMSLVAAYATYLVFPVWFERPALTVDSFATWLISIEYLDPSYNHFPSLHVATATLLWLALRDRHACRWWLGALVVGIALSTLFIKQHYVLDVAYGAALAGAAWWAAVRLADGVFRFRKLYLDVVTPAGDAVIVYLTWLDVLGLRQASAGVELYPADGAREVHHARTRVPPEAVGELLAGHAVAFRTVNDEVEVRIEEAAAPWHPEGDSPHGALRWRVVTPRARVHVRVGHRTFHGEGYADWVELDRPLRWLGVTAVRWGRVHEGSGAAVHCEVAFADGRTWSRSRGWNGAMPSHPATGRVLHEGPALDEQRFPARMARALARMATGPLHERRLLNGYALCEEVRRG